jgi:retron-type reverse transcriptase
LPTGAPTSPAIANIICRKLDKRFANLGKKVGFAYSRYADDLTFSSVDSQLMRMIPFFKEIIAEEGFQLNESKLRILRNGRRQTVTGVVVNEKPNISKNERKMLRAVLNNCNQGDIYSQKNKWASHQKRLPPGIPYSLDDFRRSLLAKIHFVKMVNPPAGQKLLSSYYSISWPA